MSTLTAPTKKKPKSVSVADILAAGGADQFALSGKGIDTRKRKLSGRIRVPDAEFKRMMDQLRKQK